MSHQPMISADTHIIEPPGIYAEVAARFGDRVPTMKRRATKDGQPFDAWYVGEQLAGVLGSFITAGQRFERPEDFSFVGLWDDVPKEAYDPHTFLSALDVDHVAAAVVQPSQGIAWYRLDDDELLSAICAASNDWMAAFAAAAPTRLRSVGMINARDVDNACSEMERCADLGIAAFFLQVYPDGVYRYDEPRYEPIWRTASELDLPLLMHIGAYASNIPGCELARVPSDDTPPPTAASRCTTDYWVRYSLATLIFSGVFDRHPSLKVGTVEHEAAWIPHWLKQMDFTYVERPELVGEWRSAEGMLPSDYWRRNMFAAFMEDDVAVRFRDMIGVENLMWGNDFPHSESTWPRSQDFLDRILAGVPDDEYSKITSGNAARMFDFDLSTLAATT